MIAVVVFGLLLMGAVILALVEDLKSERKQIAHWRSLYVPIVAFILTKISWKRLACTSIKRKKQDLRRLKNRRPPP